MDAGYELSHVFLMVLGCGVVGCYGGGAVHSKQRKLKKL